MKKQLILFTVFFISMFFLTENMNASDTLGIELDEILFFESGKEVPNKQNRVYVNCFIPEARYINIELNIKNLKYKVTDQEYKITFVWKYINGSEFGKSETTFNIKSDWEKAYINQSWGWENKGKWSLGRFTGQILINGKLFAEKDFFINPEEKDFFSFPKENKAIEELQKSTGNFKYEILQQFKTDSYFNSYYKIAFSEDGKDIAYRLSQFGQSEGYKSTTVTRNVYLFRNNKQIVPVYFRIDPFFDKSLNNLAYLGMKTTGSTFNNVFAYYNGTQLIKSIYTPTFYLSPDSKKYTYVWNSMSRLKSSFTWDAAYEYLMINQQKTQPDCLTKAKSVRITEASIETNLKIKDNPIVYIKNEDNSYNVVYTAKYKIDKQTYFALFNENKKVSPEFDGHIGKPFLSADEKKVAYIVKDKKEWFVMVNDKKVTKGYKKIKDGIVFCKSGSVIYRAKIDGDWYIMKNDEKISSGFSKIESITVNQSENKIAYKAKTGKKWSMYINNNKISTDFNVISREIILNRNGDKLAYAAANDDNMFVMINDKKISPDLPIFHQNTIYMGKGPLAITNLTFNKTGDKVAYLVNYASEKGDLISYNDQYYVMINNTKVSPKMYSTSLLSKKEGEFYYAGIDISNLILHHVKVDF